MYVHTQNGVPLNINFVDENLSKMSIPLELLTKVHLMRCLNDFTPECTAPGGSMADFNVWDRAFTLDEAVKWTTCR